MDQEIFFDIQPFDRQRVDLSKPATSVEEYMKQVIVSREQCPEVVIATASTIPQSKKPKTNFVPEDKSLKCVCEFAPGKAWNIDRSEYFANQRENLERLRIPNNPLISALHLPSVSEKERWCKLCFVQRLPDFPISPDLEKKFEHHVGIPPTLTFVKQLTDNQVNNLLLHQIEYFIAHGFSRPVLQWIFSLLLVIKKPLLQDVCSSIRVLARQCRVWRSQYGQEDLSKIYECSAIIAIVSIYFGQRDLSD